jgi:hypothetical protein
VSGVNSLKSYHFVLDIAASDYVTQPVHAEGDYVAPNTTYAKGTVGSQPFEEVVIGDHLFQKDASGNWTETQKSTSSTASGLFDPQSLASSGNPLGGIDSMFTDVKSYSNQGTDTVNGTSVNKYGFNLDIAEMLKAQGQDPSSLGVDVSTLGSLGNGTLYIDPQAKNLHKLDLQLNLGPLLNLMALAFANFGGTPTPGGVAPTPLPQLPVNMTMTISNHNNDTLPVALTDAMKQAQQSAAETPTTEAVPTVAAVPTAAEAVTPSGQSTPGTQATTGTSGQVVNGKIGDTLTLGNDTLTVNSVRRSTGGGLPPDAGNEYVILNVTVANKGTEDLPVAGLTSFALTDRAGASHDLSLTADYTNATSEFDLVANSSVKAGSNATGELGFEVKQGDKNLTLKFTPDFILNSDNYIAVKIDQ